MIDFLFFYRFLQIRSLRTWLFGLPEFLCVRSLRRQSFGRARWREIVAIISGRRNVRPGTSVQKMGRRHIRSKRKKEKNAHR